MVTVSGWMGQRFQGPVWEVTPDFEPTRFEKCPNQGEGSDDCGLYVVLNAWAVMLGIPITKLKKLKLPEGKDLGDFHESGGLLMNWALRGCLDFRTIQAFLKVWGYSVGQQLDKLLPEVRTEPMDDKILDDSVDARKNAKVIETRILDDQYDGSYLW